MLTTLARLDEASGSAMANAGFRQLDGGGAEVNGLDAYVGTYQGAVEGLGVVTVAAHIVHGRNVYLLAGLAPANQFKWVERQFTSSIRSFRSLSEAEATNIRPNRIDVYTVRNGDNWLSIASRAWESTIEPATLAI